MPKPIPGSTLLVLLFAFIACIRQVIAFSALPRSSSYTSSCSGHNTILGRNVIQMSIVARQPFNPFTARQRNTKVKWFEADLDSFYMFVEDQPLLTAEQELQYGKALKMWIQVEAVREQLSTKDSEGNTVNVSNEDLSKHIGCSVTTLEKMSKYADMSKIRLVNSNLKLVLAVVSRYRTSAIPNAELIAEGTRGLAKAVIRYDYSKGFRFATYATWYVHQAIAEYVRWRKHPAKMPSRYLLLLRKVREFTAQFKESNNRVPSITEISAGLGASHFDVSKVMSMQTYPTLLCAPVQSAKSNTHNEGRERTFEDLVPSLFKAPIALSDSKDLRREMESMMQSNLNEVERDVLRLRLGLDDGRAKAVKEVGKRFKISWKQVRSVEKEALSKLLDSEEISEFVDSYNRV